MPVHKTRNAHGAMPTHPRPANSTKHQHLRQRHPNQHLRQRHPNQHLRQCQTLPKSQHLRQYQTLPGSQHLRQRFTSQHLRQRHPNQHLRQRHPNQHLRQFFTSQHLRQRFTSQHLRQCQTLPGSQYLRHTNQRLHLYKMQQARTTSLLQPHRILFPLLHNHTSCK